MKKKQADQLLDDATNLKFYLEQTLSLLERYVSPIVLERNELISKGKQKIKSFNKKIWDFRVNLSKEIVKYPKRLKPVPKPLYVVRCDDHFMVCELDNGLNLVKEVSAIHWDHWTIRRWAFEFAKEYK